MLSPNYLVNRVDDITNLYSDLHTAALEAIARHIAAVLRPDGEGDITPSRQYQIERLQHSGMVRDEIIRRVAEINRAGSDEIRRLFEDAAIQSIAYDNSVYAAAGLTPIAIDQSPAMLQILSAGISKTLGSVERLTGTFATNSEERFHNLLNLGYNKTVSGMFSYDKAINDAVDDLARSGVGVFHYSSGRAISIEAAVRMNVLTGANQTAAQITKEGMRELGVSLVRTTAHLGARNKGVGFINHESWQGKVFYWRELDIGNRSVDKSQNTQYNVYMEAKNGGRNRGAYITLSSQSDEQLLKSIKSYSKNVSEHEDKIRNPDKYVENWEHQDERYKAGLIKFWGKDIRKNSEQLTIAMEIARERGISV